MVGEMMCEWRKFQRVLSRGCVSVLGQEMVERRVCLRVVCEGLPICNSRTRG